MSGKGDREASAAGSSTISSRSAVIRSDLEARMTIKELSRLNSQSSGLAHASAAGVVERLNLPVFEYSVEDVQLVDRALEPFGGGAGTPPY